ncbi:MAG: pentapeptide repeat-containing protein [bacterium]
MAVEKHLKILKQGVEAWNQWREQNPDIQPDLREASLRRAKLSGVNLSKANLSDASLTQAKLVAADFSAAILSGTNLIGANLNKGKLARVNLSRANLMGANLIDANLMAANLRKANLSGAHLSGACLRQVDLREANLHEAFLLRANLHQADLSGANLSQAHLVSTIFTEADLTGCLISGLSAWDLKLNDNTKQTGLVITLPGESTITVDNLEIAQVIFRLLTNKKFKPVINTVTQNVVLILGCFNERKGVQTALANELRKLHLCPITFDFQKFDQQDIMATVIRLTKIVKFIIADVTSAKTMPAKLNAFVPVQAIPVVPLFQSFLQVQNDYESISILHKKFHWLLQPVEYKSKVHLIKILQSKVVQPAEIKYNELQNLRSCEIWRS